MGYVDQKGDRALYVDPGANDLLEFREIDLEYASNTRFLHLTSFAGRKPFQAQTELAKAVSDIKISLDPGTLYARKGLESLKPIVEHCSVMFPSGHEVKLLTGKDYEKGSEILTRKGVDIVAVKLGERGCYVTDGQGSYVVEPYKVEVADTTGAGDAFCAGFLYGLIENKELYECGKLGNFVASRCIMKSGARRGLPRLSDLRNI
jgi:ribokinase